MKKSILILSLLILAVGAVIVFSLPKNKEGVSPEEQSSPNNSFSSQTDNQGGVTVTVTPKDISPNSSLWNFEIVLDTHTNELNQDLVQTSVLKDEKGKEYRPLAWQGDGPGGHHRKGILQFNTITLSPQSLELIISGVGGVGERRFVWNTKR